MTTVWRCGMLGVSDPLQILPHVLALGKGRAGRNMGEIGMDPKGVDVACRDD